MKRRGSPNLLEKWPNKKINSKELNKIFQVDGIPLWYLMEPLLKLPYIPKPFKNLEETQRDVENNKAPGFLDSIWCKITYFAMKRGLLLNEKIKLLISPKPKENVEKKDVLFLGYTNQVLWERKRIPKPIGFSDVLEDLKKQGIKSLVLYCDPLSKNSFRGLLKFPELLYSYVSPEIIERSKKISYDLHRKWKNLDEKKKEEMFTFSGKNYWKLLKDEINFLFSREVLSILITYYFTFKKIVEGRNIKVIYLESLGGFYETLLLGVAYRLNKKVVYSPHGYGDRYFIVRKEFLKNVHFAAWGSEGKRRLLKLGIKEENIFITGSPFFDKIADYKTQKKPTDKKTVTLLTSALVEYKYIEKDEYFRYIRKYLTEISKVKNVGKIVIKLHPDERYKSKYEAIAKSLKLGNVEVVQKAGKETLYSILRDSDLLVSFGSTADIEALMLDKDVIVVEGFFGEFYQKDPYKKAVVGVGKCDNLTYIVDKILNVKEIRKELKQAREKYLKQAFYRIDGRAHERIANLIYRQIKEIEGC